MFICQAINSITGQSMDVRIIVAKRPRETSWLISGTPHTVCLSLIKITSGNPEHISLCNCCYLFASLQLLLLVCFSTTQVKTLSFLRTLTTIEPPLNRAPVAHFVEHRALMREAVSSTPAGPTLRVLK